VAVLLSETLPTRRTGTNTNPEQLLQTTWQQAMRHMLSDTTFMLFAAATLLTSVVFMQAFSTLPMHLSLQGYTEQQIGLAMSINGVLIVLLQVPLTHVLNGSNRVLILLVGELLITIGFGMSIWTSVVALLLISITTWTVGEVIQTPFKQSLVADLAPLEMRGRYMEVFSLCHAIGMTVGVPTGGFILDRIGPTFLWNGCLVCGVAATVCFVAMHRSHASGIRTRSV